MHKKQNELECAVVAQRVRARTSTPILFFGEYDEYDTMTDLKLLHPKDAPLLPAVIASLPLKPREAMFSKSIKHRIGKASMERSNSREAKPQKRELVKIERWLLSLFPAGKPYCAIRAPYQPSSPMIGGRCSCLRKGPMPKTWLAVSRTNGEHERQWGSLHIRQTLERIHDAIPDRDCVLDAPPSSDAVLEKANAFAALGAPLQILPEVYKRLALSEHRELS